MKKSTTVYGSTVIDMVKIKNGIMINSFLKIVLLVCFCHLSLCMATDLVISGRSIAEREFAYRSDITSVTIDCVNYIGNEAFYGCTGLTSINIGKYLLGIGNGAFSGCTGLTSITLPDSVTSIGQDAFSDCTGLTSVNIPNSVTSIGQGAFSWCTGLTSVSLGNSIRSMGSGVFLGCKISVINVAKGSQTLKCQKGILYNYPMTTIILCPRTIKGNLSIPEGITSIGSGAFMGCTGLTSITLPNSVRSIEERAFFDCTGLISINIPNSVRSIAEKAFYGCTSLTSVNIPNSVQIVGGYAFANCSNLSEVTIEVSPNQSLETSLFNECGKIVHVYFPNGEPSQRLSFGQSSPLIFASSGYYNGYKVINADVLELDKTKISKPTTEGKIGQVLMVTANGYEWVDIPGGYSAAIAESFQLQVGWNLLSMPEAELTVDCKKELMSRYQFFTYDAKRKMFVSVEDLLPRSSYWVYAKESCTVHFTVLK